jgi:hypothetical protein
MVPAARAICRFAELGTAVTGLIISDYHFYLDIEHLFMYINSMASPDWRKCEPIYFTSQPGALP